MDFVTFGRVRLAVDPCSHSFCAKLTDCFRSLDIYLPTLRMASIFSSRSKSRQESEKAYSPKCQAIP